MRKRDKIKNITPFIFGALWAILFWLMGATTEGGDSLLVVGGWVALVLISVLVTDEGIDLFDKNDNEEDD